MALHVLENLLETVAEYKETPRVEIKEPPPLEIKEDVLSNTVDPNRIIEYIENCESIAAHNPMNPSSDSDHSSAVQLLIDWTLAQDIKDLKLNVLHHKRRSPFIFIEIAATLHAGHVNTVLMCGHLNQRPPLPTDQLHGSHTVFAAVQCIKALQNQNVAHPRCCILIEGAPQSDATDLLHYVNHLKNRIKTPRVVICFDSGCQNYERLWMTVSFRGVFEANLKAQLLSEAIHSGESGLVRDSFHVLRQILDRIDDVKAGRMFNDLCVEIPDLHVEYAKDCAKALGGSVYAGIPFYNEDCGPQMNKFENNLYDLVLNRTWRPQLCITGMDGMPGLKGGNVLRKYTAMKVSVHIPPSMHPKHAQNAVKAACEATPTPCGANVECVMSGKGNAGFVCPEFEDWFLESMHNSSKTYFGRRAQFRGEGGNAVFLNKLQKNFRRSQFMITGILGPDIGFTKKVMCCVANILHDITQRGLNDKKMEIASNKKMTI